jgi:hypothetical protein
MQYKHKKYVFVVLAFNLIILASFACKVTGSPTQELPPPITQVIAVTQVIPITQIVPVTQVIPVTEIPPNLETLLVPKIILQRLGVSFLGQDGHKVIGSGCPGNDGKGTIVDYHLTVNNVDEDKKIQRIIVAGDNSTLTWELPCSDAWALSVKNSENGNLEIFIAPSMSSRVYTVMIFYEDNSFALGMSVGR